MTWWAPTYDPSDHEQVIEALYDRVDSGRRGPFPVERALFICFTNRSGSNFLAAALASTGSVKPAREYLNHPVVRRRTERLGLEHFDEYLRQLGNEFGHRGTLTMKAGLRQLYYLAKLGFLDNLLPNPTFILITRDDVVAQAVSWVIASQTGQWTSNHDREDVEPEYDFSAIDNRIEVLLEENKAFRAFLARNGATTEHVRYEQLLSDPKKTTRSLCDALGLVSGEYRAERVQIKSQHSSLNKEWKNRYLTDVRSM